MIESTLPIEKIINSSPVPMLVVDQKGMVELWNRAAEHLFEWPAAEIVGLSVLQTLQTESGFDDFEKWIDRVLEGEAEYDEITEEIRVTNRSHELLHLRVTATPLISQSATSYLLIMDDITQKALSREILERQVQDRTRKLSILYDLLELGSSTDEREPFLEKSLQKAILATRSTGGTIHIFDSDLDRFVLIAYSRLNESEADDIHYLSSKFPPLESLGHFFSSMPSVIKHKAVPIIDNTGLKGWLTIFSQNRKGGRFYGEDDQTLAESIGSQIGITLENIRLRSDRKQLLLSEERNRLARALHDAITQSLYSLTLMTGAARSQFDLGHLDMVDQLIDRQQTVALDALKEMRLMIHNLRPSLLTTNGLTAAIKQRLDAVERRAGIQATLQVPNDLNLSSTIEETLYFVIQEGLNNALKHAEATSIEVTIEQAADKVTCSICDNGNGFDVQGAKNEGGFGLSSMHERIVGLNGTFSIESQKKLDRGSIVKATIPFIPESLSES